MDWVTLAIIVYLECAAFCFIALFQSDMRQGTVTRGDLAFICFIAVCGPCGLGAAFAAIGDGKFKDFWSALVWRKR